MKRTSGTRKIIFSSNDRKEKGLPLAIVEIVLQL